MRRYSRPDEVTGFELSAFHENKQRDEADVLAALKEAHYFILAPAEDLKEGVLSRIRAAIAKADHGFKP